MITKSKMRLARWIAQSGFCSRREAERWILQGRVRVNDMVVSTPAYCVTTVDTVLVDGMHATVHQETKIWRYYKPAGIITTHRDPEGRPTVFKNLPSSMPRVISVGRLDINSEGLLLLTNDGALSRFLEHPQQNFERTYRVRVYGTLTPSQLDPLKQGMTIEGIHYRPIQVKVAKARTSKTGETSRNNWLTLTLNEGKNREIRKVMQAVHLDVNRLIRTHYGPFDLGTLKPGEVEEVKPWPSNFQKLYPRKSLSENA